MQSTLATLFQQDARQLRGPACIGDPLLYAGAHRRHFLAQYRANPAREITSRSPHPYRWGLASAMRAVRLPGGVR